MVIGIYEAIRRASGCQEGEILMSFERALCGLGATVSLAALLASATPALAQAAAPAGEAVQEARPSDAAAGALEVSTVRPRTLREPARQTPASVPALPGPRPQRQGFGNGRHVREERTG